LHGRYQGAAQSFSSVSQALDSAAAGTALGSAPVLAHLRTKRWATLVVINVRILIGFAFLPAGLKKLLDEPFTDPANTGAFHDFLDAFHATGAFYQFVGVMQLVTATLLITQRFATLGALFAVPITATIAAFCWSTIGVSVTAVVITLMFLGSLGLALWDLPRWRLVFARDDRAHEIVVPPRTDRVSMRLWQLCGLAIVTLYFATCAALGGVYRPKGMEMTNPAFYVMPAIFLLPFVTLAIDQLRLRR
jgi:uncharacterized membrane protein YphA (DoxX/SURF4 family)